MNVHTDWDEWAASSEMDSLGTYDMTAGSAKLEAQSHQESWLLKIMMKKISRRKLRRYENLGKVWSNKLK